MIESFEWLRPAWLLALVPGLALIAWWWRVRAGDGPWRGVVDAELFEHLALRGGGTRRWVAPLAAALALVLVCAALAGPSWRAQPTPMLRELSARIVVLDLSPSMNAIDVTPSRLEQARGAVISILRESTNLQLGLVVFAADAFTVAPLTADAATLIHLVGSLATTTAPRAGARPDLGLQEALSMLQRSAIPAGDVILVADSAGDARALVAARSLARAGFPLSVLAIGTPHGGPVRLASGAFAVDARGEVVVARPDLQALGRLAQDGGGALHTTGPDGRVPRFTATLQPGAAVPETTPRAARVPLDDGAWLVLFALPLAALLFRRGWLAAFALCAFGLPAPDAVALDWSDLWRRPDQQAAAAFAHGRVADHTGTVAKLAQDSPWRAALLYRSARYAEAAAHYAQHDSAQAHYNRGNALALEGRLEAALEAYRSALDRNPGMADALFNQALVREALAKRRARERARPPEEAAGAQSGEAQTQNPQRRFGPGQGTERREARGEPRAGPSRSPDTPSPGDAETGRDADAARAQPGDAADRHALSRAERRRLERLLAEVNDDPGSLLANRFAWQLRTRGVLHRDPGERW